jgi:hypothetical protein
MILVMVATLLASCPGAFAQGLNIPWSTIDNGGAGRGSAVFANTPQGTLRLSGTIGQWDAGRSNAVVGPNQFVLSSGYWVVGRVCPGDGPGACGPGDLDENGTIDFNDFLAFLNLFNNNDLCVDYDGTGSIDFNDLLAYLNLFNTPC